jgi:hypothetical protein
MGMKRRASRPGKGRPGPWYGNVLERLNFERGTRAAFPSFRPRFGHGGGGYIIHVDVDVPGYDPRHLRIVFDRDHLGVPRVLADGPTNSKHRYGNGALCMWYPSDPVENRWVRDDGLLSLIGCAILHLFREAWWRETGHWLGPEAPHDVSEPKEPEHDDHRRH